jgi:hypothetical protein
LDTEKVDLGRQEQVSFETKEELLRLAHGILLKSGIDKEPLPESTSKAVKPQSVEAPKPEVALVCAACAKPITGKPHTEVLNGKIYTFDCDSCAKTYRG